MCRWSIAALASIGSAASAGQLVVTVTHDRDAARPSETITVPWSEVARVLPGARRQQLAVRNAAGLSLPYQVTDVDPLAKEPKNLGVSYGELIFQHDFASPAPPGSGRAVLVSSGIDVWSKRVRYAVVDRWYNKGHDHYHVDEGMDLYPVGASRGCGGTGVWDGRQLHVGRNYATVRVIANGPIRAVFELTYEPWAAGGIYVSEVKRITVDAGHYLDRIESTFSATGNTKELMIGIGLNKSPSDPGQDPQTAVTRAEAAGSPAQWIVQRTNGSLGTALIVPAGSAGFAEDDRNVLALAKAAPGQRLTYPAGAGWSRAGDFADAQPWNEYVAALAARLRSPVRVAVSAAPWWPARRPLFP